MAKTEVRTNMTLDTEKLQLDTLVNEFVATYSWSECTVAVKDRATSQEKLILHDVSGSAQAGTFTMLVHAVIGGQNLSSSWRVPRKTYSGF